MKRFYEGNVLENMTFGIAVMDKEYNLVYWNKRLEEIVGDFSKNKTTRNVFELFPSLAETGLEKLIKDTMENCRPNSRRSHIPVRKSIKATYLNFNFIPVMGENGKSKGQIAAIEDVSDMREARERANFLANLVEHSGDAIMSCDLDRNFTYWNKGAEKVFGYTKEEVVGKKVDLIVPPELAEGSYAFLDEVKEKGMIKDYFTHRMRKDGKKIAVDFTINMIKDSDGNPKGFSAIVKDVTELKNAELRARRAYDKLESITQELLTTNIDLKRTKINLEERNRELEKINKDLLTKKIKLKELRNLLQKIEKNGDKTKIDVLIKGDYWK